MTMNSEKSMNTSLKNLDFASINKNQLNTSSSKMQYSFPKSSRFHQEHKSFSSNRYYDLPSTKIQRAASFGYGNKLDLSKRNFVTPPPDTYRLSSDFKLNPKAGFTMAQGRNQIKTNDMFYQGLKQCPEPTTYSPKNIHDSLKFSLYPRIQDKSDKWVKSVPGPGTYSQIQLTNSKGKSSLSKYTSAISGKFDQLPRLSEVQLAKNKNPGPNQYKNTAQLLEIFKYEKKGGNIFSRGARLGIAEKSITPGPGNYNSFSQFV